MSIVSPAFYALLAVTVLLTRVVPAAARQGVLLAASALFYFSGNPASAAIGLTIVAANYLCLRTLLGEAGETRRTRIYFASVAGNLLFFVILKLAFEPVPGVTPRHWFVGGLSFGYPLGLSFVILMLHAALTDAYSQKYGPRNRPGTFFLYGLFFPYVTSGPVERLAQMEGQLEAPPRPRFEDILAGVCLIALGLVKKVVVANRIGPYVDAVFGGELEHSATTVAIAIALNTAWMYADFSGYTDIARGAARCLGIDIRINFDRPFRSRSVTEFWRRWHISFSSWLRDYLYMPLAFSLGRVTKAAPVIAIVLTFLAAGFWHRAAWTFILFGLLHGVVLALELLFGRPIRGDAPHWRRWSEILLARAYTLVFLALAIVLFSAADLAQAGAILWRLFSSPILPWPRELFGYLGPFLFLLMAATITGWQILERWQERLGPRTAPAFLFAAGALVLFMGTEGPGFIYEQF